MKDFEISKYIKKILPLIIIISLVLTVVIYFVLCNSRKYVASTVIEFTDSNAAKGLTPAGTTFDINEMKSSSIMSKVIYNLGLDPSLYSVDDLISRVSITPVVDSDEKSRKEALLEAGEEYTLKPTTYIFSFSATNDEGPQFARSVLDEILDEAFSSYSEKYINTTATTNSITSMDKSTYDYIEMLSLIDQNISETIDVLWKRSSSSSGFRSSDTGMSFDDLAIKFDYLQNVNISDLYSRVLENQITKDKNMLISKYQKKITDYDISYKTAQEQIDNIDELVEAYLAKMEDSGNTDLDTQYVLNTVFGSGTTTEDGQSYIVANSGDTLVTYDKLMFAWVEHRETQEYAMIDKAYSEYILNLYKECKGDCEDTCKDSDLTCSAISNPEYGNIVNSIDSSISSLISQISTLYSLVDRTTDEYNKYLGAFYISTLSTASVASSINVELYTAIAGVFLLFICCFGSILIGRIDDIIQYMFYTDHLTELNNRNALDKYLDNKSGVVCDDGTICVYLRICNQIAINNEYGRETGDGVIKLFATNLKSTYGKLNSFLVYNGNSQFFTFAEGVDYPTAQQLLNHMVLLIQEREDYAEVPLEFEIGFSEAEHDKARKYRVLLSKSVGNKEKYEA